MVKFRKWINNFYGWDITKVFISVGKEKVHFTLFFYLKQNKEVQLDLQHFEIFIFSSILPSFSPRKMSEEKLTYGFLIFGCLGDANRLLSDSRLTKSKCQSQL